MASRILVVDDDRRVVEILAPYLRGDGYDVATAATAADGVRLARSWQPDLVVLDLRLPDAGDMEGFVRIRAVSRAPIIMLTANDAEVQKILGLEVGADDYITKPFSPREVVARIRTVLRRAAGSKQPDVVRVDGLEIDREAQEVLNEGREVALTRTEYRILELLALSPGRVFPRAELLAALRADTDVLDRTLDKHVTNLRRKLETESGKPQYIQTVYGVGYKFRKPVESGVASSLREVGSRGSSA